MTVRKQIEDILEKIHQQCCLAYEENHDCAEYVEPILRTLSEYSHEDSKILLANILLDRDPEKFDEAKTLYLQCIKNGNACAMYNLYVSYAERGDKINAYRFYKMAKNHRYPSAIEEEFMSYRP